MNDGAAPISGTEETDGMAAGTLTSPSDSTCPTRTSLALRNPLLVPTNVPMPNSAHAPMNTILAFRLLARELLRR